MKMVIYSPTCCSKPIRLWLFFKTQIKIFLIKPEIFPFLRRSNKVIKVISGFIKNILIYVVKIIFQALLVCRDMRVSKWWQNHCFGVNYSFKGILHPKWKFGHLSLTPTSFRTRKSFVCLQNTTTKKFTSRLSDLRDAEEEVQFWSVPHRKLLNGFGRLGHLQFFWIITNWTRIYWKYLFIGKEDTF